MLTIKIAFSGDGFEEYAECTQGISIGALRAPVAEHRVFAERKKNGALAPFLEKKLMKTKLVSLTELLFIGTMVLTASKMLAATAPAGWKVLVDKTKSCQISVPPDWVVTTFSPSGADSPDNKSDLRMEVTNLGHTLREFKATAEHIYAPIKIFEDSKRRLWFSYKETTAPEGSRIMYYFVGIPVNGNVCAAQIHFDNRRVELVAKQIAESLAAAK